MLGHKIFTATLILAGLNFLSACGKEDGSRNCLDGTNCGDTTTVINVGSASTFSGGSNIQPTSSSSGTIQCSVDAPTIVTAGQLVTLTIRAAGGTVASGASLVQYSIPTMPQYGSFSSTVGNFAQLTASGSYNNSSTNGTSVVATRTFSIADQAGHTGTCSFSITVQPSSYSGTIQPGNSACLLTTATPTALVNQPITFNLSATSYPTLIQTISFQPNWNSTINASLTGPTNFGVTYTSVGPRTITVVVQNGGSLYTCSTAVTVTNSLTPTAPSLQISAQPGSTVNVGSTITVTAVGSGFASSPTYGFTTSEAGVRLVTTGNTVAVTAIDGKAHNFTVNATATVGAQSASAQIPLTFQGGSTTGAYCLLQAASGTLTVNSPLSVSVVATDANGNILANQPVELTEVTATSGVVSTGLANPIGVKYSAVGTYVIGVRAVLQNSGVPCNGGGVMQEAITIH